MTLQEEFEQWLLEKNARTAVSPVLKNSPAAQFLDVQKINAAISLCDFNVTIIKNETKENEKIPAINNNGTAPVAERPESANV